MVLLLRRALRPPRQLKRTRHRSGHGPRATSAPTIIVLQTTLATSVWLFLSMIAAAPPHRLITQAAAQRSSGVHGCFRLVSRTRRTISMWRPRSSSIVKGCPRAMCFCPRRRTRVAAAAQHRRGEDAAGLEQRAAAAAAPPPSVGASATFFTIWCLRRKAHGRLCSSTRRHRSQNVRCSQLVPLWRIRRISYASSSFWQSGSQSVAGSMLLRAVEHGRRDVGVRCIVVLAGEDVVEFWRRHGYEADSMELSPEKRALLRDPFGGSKMVAKWV